MKKLIRKYRDMSFEQKTIFKTIIGLCFSGVLAGIKFVIGLFADFDLCGVAVYSVAMLLSKFECVLGVKSNKRTFKQRNALISAFLFVSSLIYIGFMSRLFFIDRDIEKHDFFYVMALALISFVELGLAIAGLIRTNNRGHFYRDIKIIDLGIALIAILTTQMTLLDYTSTANTDIYTAYAGIGVGALIAICAVYILFAPKTSIIGRERNVFILKNKNKNSLIDTTKETVEITLAPSPVYGSYVYCSTFRDGTLDGNIVRRPSIWKKMHILLKILCCILSEILIFIWFIGRIIFYFRTINLPRRLEKIMNKNGFEKVEIE